MTNMFFFVTRMLYIRSTTRVAFSSSKRMLYLVLEVYPSACNFRSICYSIILFAQLFHCVLSLQALFFINHATLVFFTMLLAHLSPPSFFTNFGWLGDWRLTSPVVLKARFSTAFVCSLHLCTTLLENRCFKVLERRLRGCVRFSSSTMQLLRCQVQVLCGRLVNLVSPRAPQKISLSSPSADCSAPISPFAPPRSKAYEDGVSWASVGLAAQASSYSVFSSPSVPRQRAASMTTAVSASTVCLCLASLEELW